MAEFMISLRQADGSDGVGLARYLTFENPTNPPTSSATDSTAWMEAIIDSFPEPARAAGPRLSFRRTGEILFLVHGFNVGHTAACQFHMQCVNALATAGWKGKVVSFDWPSDGLVFAYLPDRANARAAASTLVTSAIALLEDAQQDDCTIDVHVMAHSMGAFVVQQAFTWAYQDVPPDWSIGQLLLVAGDVDYTVFSAGAPSAEMFVKHAGRLTNYRNRFDKALVVSNAKRLDLAPRVGRVGLPSDAPGMMCEVDCSALFQKVDPNPLQSLDPQATHCFYFDQPAFWRDAVLTLAGGVERSAIPTREADATTPTPDRFVLKPNGVSDASYHAAIAQASVSPSVRLS